MQTKAFHNAPVFSLLQSLAVAIQTGTKTDAIAKLREVAANPVFVGKTGWQKNFAKLEKSFFYGAEYSIFATGGNSKLPFVAFSTLPGVTCPGAGDCLIFCYSFRAWRYPAAFCRMAQNAYFMRHNHEAISAAFSIVDAANPAGFDFRLYVDGDFSSPADVAFWFDLLNTAPKCRAYGYSKSFEAILTHAAIVQTLPANYLLNISGGHNANPATIAAVKTLSITRGEFIAVSIGRKVKSTDHGTVSNNRAIREAMGATKVFPCPGKCGTCTGAGHACGLPVMRGRVIAIAMH